MDLPRIEELAFPGVTALVCFLAYSSQWLFYHIEPGPPRKGDIYFFNTLVAFLLVSYTRTCYTDPGRIPNDWYEKYELKGGSAQTAVDTTSRQRYCRKCEMPKPPRSHHCKTCRRCIMKMDHHCVWTANCISHITLPHFIRFLVYAVSAMSYLEYFLYLRCAVIWQSRNLPSYLGPSVFQLSHLFILVVTNSLVLFALTLLLGRTIWSLALNQTTVEGWEIERHHTLLRRARVMGGLLDGPNGEKVRIDSQEFPWDIGIWANICQAMGTWNPIAWFWPFAFSPSVESGLAFQHNEIDDPSKPWPPPDPDRIYRTPRAPLTGDGFTQSLDVEEFRKRQQADLRRFDDGERVVRRRPFHERYEQPDKPAPRVYEVDDDGQPVVSDGEEDEPELADLPRYGGFGDEGEEAWRNKEGERLADFGMDEDAEFYDEDDLPLAEILRRRKAEQ